MNCKGCGTSISEEDSRKVAQWYFCPHCFENLMDSSEKQTDLATETDAVDRKKEIAQNPDTLCHLCQVKIEAGAEKVLGIWTLCDACYQDMNASTKMPDSDPEDIEAEQQEEDGDIDPLPRVDMNKTIPCACCSRYILEVAAKEYDGQALCPDCYYKKREENA